MSSLDLETITKLLQEDKTQKATSSPTKKYESPIEVGPLSFIGDYAAICVSPRCGSPSRLKVNGAAYCSSHALYELNRIILHLTSYGWVLQECNCKAGHYSKQSCHTDDCATYQRLKENSIGNGSTESA